MAIIVSTGALAAANATSPSVWIKGPFNFSLQGTFVGTCVLERSFDSGSTWEILSRDTAGNQCSYTAPVSFSGSEPEDTVQYRARASAYTSGTLNTRIAQ